MRNVARCWCYETGRLLGKVLADDLPSSVSWWSHHITTCAGLQP